MSHRVIALHEGTFSVGLDKKFNRIKDSDPPAKGALKLSLRPFLIESEGRIILIDCGLGSFGEENHYEVMLSNLEDLGFSELDITDVVCSHLHYDHIGGLAHRSNGYWELSFPDAAIWASGKEWAKLQSISDEDGPRTEFLDFLEARADLRLMDDEGEPSSFIKSLHMGGHTEFSRLIEIRLDNQLFLMAGDVLGTRGSVNRSYAAKYDFDGKKSMQIRSRLITRAYEENAILMAYHDTICPMFRLTDYHKDKGYTIENIQEFKR
ncbi:MAG: MBL fold metallo-hydrolase [Balneolales bacterium]|nr:MBL fold metallo-hydrolase [Balneolales bacterium]